MKKYVLDTNVISEMRKRKPHGAVLAWLSSLQEQEVCLAAVTLGELQRGMERTLKLDRSKAREIETWINLLERVYQIVPMDSPCFREWARLMERKSDDLIEDAMIAATARVHNLVVATRNDADFKDFDVEVFNPFKT